MAEIIADAVDYPIARAISRTAEGKRQSPGQRPGVETAKAFYYPFDVTIWHGGTAEVIPELTLAVVFGGSATDFDVTVSRWISFTIVGSGLHYICTQQDWAAITAANDAIGIEYHTRGGWRRHQPFAGQLTPPVTPILIITSDDGGSSFATAFGSNPYTIHGHYGAGTMVLDMLRKTFVSDELGSSSNEPSHGATASAGWTVTGDWLTQDFLPDLATNGNTWESAADNGDGGGFYDLWFSPPQVLMGASEWHPPHFGNTIPGASFDATAIRDQATSRGIAFIQTNTNGYGGGPTPVPGTEAMYATDVMLVRGIISLPPFPPDSTLTGIGLVIWNGTEGWFTADELELNNPLWSNGRNTVRPTSAPGQQPKGRYPGTGYWDWSVTAGLWVWGGDNHLNMSVQGAYTTAAAAYPAKDLEAATYVDVAFDFDNGTNWATPPSGWQTGGGGEFVADGLVTAPAWFPSATQGSDLSTGVGVDGRAYFVSNLFSVPGSFSTCVLKITAETGIGEIDINGTVIATRSETVDLWTSHTILTYTIPAADFTAGTTNIVAAQCYSTTGTCQIFYSLSFFL